MPFPWATVLGAIPWTDLVKAAPELARRAKRVLGRGESAAEPAPAAPAPVAPGTPAERMEALAQQVAALEARQRQSDDVVRSLAEQHETLVQAGELLRRRLRRLTWWLWGLIGAVALWAVVQSLR